jgi:UDP-N-acetylglucosamine 2-epimerase (non-hydrolysing)
MQALLDDPQAYRRMSRVENPYGDGFASRRIAAHLVAEETGGVSPVRPFEPLT